MSGAGSRPRGTGPAGSRLSSEEFGELFDSLAQWRHGAPVDEAGRLGSRSADDVLAATRTVRRGQPVSLSLALDKETGPDNPRPALHHMVDLGDAEAREPSAHKDFLGFDYHGKAVTHLDALCHIGYRGLLYGGTPSSDALSSRGSEWAAVTTLAAGIVVRAVLYDVPRVRGVEWLEPGDAVHGEDLAAIEQSLGVSAGPGDALLLRTGRQRRRTALGPWDSAAESAGFHVDAIPMVAERGVALLGSDGDNDVRPSPVDGVHSPIHALALTALGMVLLDNLDLEGLSEACATYEQYDFLLVVAPLVVPGGTGSPVNPIAVL